jgi:chemotaxis protein MotB
MAGHGGGAWKVAYADFVTAMMAFFLVMWITAQGKDVKQAVAQYFRDPFNRPVKAERPGPSIASHKRGATSQAKKSRGRSIADPVSEIPGDKNSPDSQPQRLAIYDGTRSTLGTTIVFANNSAELSAEGKSQLKRLLPTFVGKLNKIEIRGHASGRPLPPGSPFGDVWQLCYRRSQAVMEYLKQEGLEANRIRLSQAGPFEHRALSEDSEKQPPENRVEIYMLGEFTEEIGGVRNAPDVRSKAH